ncbi:MAG: hypothetical protein M0Z95_07250 [Actinomycetota bacterium]|nr:hypothetical protein [Actinomycetota bacterium]
MLLSGGTLAATWRSAPASTMVVTRDPGELYLLRHTGGDAAVSFVEQIDPVTLEPMATSEMLPGGPAWPGSLAVHANGSLYVVFGNHVHRLAPDLSIQARTTLSCPRPYNGFVIMPDGTLVTKDFAGSRPGVAVAPECRQPTELVALDPVTLEVVATCPMVEPSVARLSAIGDTVYVVGDTSLLRARWDGSLTADPEFRVPYRVRQGQTYGWDCVLAAGAAWFLDDGDGSEGYSGTLRGHGLSTAPLHLVRVDLADGTMSSAQVGDGPGGLVANPPVVDDVRGVAVGFDSGNGVIQAFTIAPGGKLVPRWRRRQDHGSHMVLWPDTGELLTADFDRDRGSEDAVVLDVETGKELARVGTGSPLQSVLFPAVGFSGDAYLCSFTTVTRVVVA